MSLETILLSNVPHYHHLASALQQSGCLKRYITTIALTTGVSTPGILPDYWQRKLEGRRINGVTEEKIRQLWLPELLQRGLPMTGLISADRGNWINNHLFDWMAERWIEDCDVFHFVNSVGLYCGRKAKRFGATLVCDVRQAHPVFQRSLLEEEYKRLGIAAKNPGQLYVEKMLEEFDLADYLVVPSSYVKETFVRHGNEASRIVVNQYGTDLSYFQRKGAMASGFRILYVGRITAEKGVHYLLQAFDQLKPIKAELLLIGPLDPNFKPILKRCEGKFTHIPALPKSDLANYYSSSSVLVLPSLTDSFGLVVPEAMACGLPVIVTENCGSKEVVTNGKEGFIVPIRDVEALKEKILYLYENPDFREQMGNAALERAQEVTWEAYGNRAQAFYSQLAQQTHRPVEMLQNVAVG